MFDRVAVFAFLDVVATTLSFKWTKSPHKLHDRLHLSNMWCGFVLPLKNKKQFPLYILIMWSFFQRKKQKGLLQSPREANIGQWANSSLHKFSKTKKIRKWKERSKNNQRKLILLTWNINSSCGLNSFSCSRLVKAQIAAKSTLNRHELSIALALTLGSPLLTFFIRVHAFCLFIIEWLISLFFSITSIFLLVSLGASLIISTERVISGHVELFVVDRVVDRRELIVGFWTVTCSPLDVGVHGEIANVVLLVDGVVGVAVELVSATLVDPPMRSFDTCFSTLANWVEESIVDSPVSDSHLLPNLSTCKVSRS